MGPESTTRLTGNAEAAPSLGYARMSGCVLIVDPGGEVREALSGTRALLGTRPRDTVGRRLEELLDAIGDQDLPSALAEAMEGRVVERNARTDHASHVALWFVPFPGSPPGVAVLGRDLSIINELLHTLEENQEMTRMGRSTVAAARDVRETLTALRSAGGALMVPGLAPSHRGVQEEEFRQELDRAGRSVGRLVDAAGEWEALDERFELREVVDEVLTLKRDLMRQEEIRVEETGMGIPTWVLARRRPTRTAVLTLLGNAVHALARNPVERPRRLRLGYEVLGSRYVSLLIEDTAGGLPPLIQQEVFEQENPRGVHALGLVRARTIAREAGGALLLDNHPGEGARFTLLLPRTP